MQEFEEGFGSGFPGVVEVLAGLETAGESEGEGAEDGCGVFYAFAAFAKMLACGLKKL